MVSWEDHERLACDHLAEHVGDASLTGPGRDAGVDVRASGCVAQVKAMVRPVGQPDLQRLVGARRRYEDGVLLARWVLQASSRVLGRAPREAVPKTRFCG